MQPVKKSNIPTDGIKYIKEFKDTVDSLDKYLKQTKKSCDAFDKQNPQLKINKKLTALKAHKVFENIDSYSKKLYILSKKNTDNDIYEHNKKYLQDKIVKYFICSPINKHMLEKPLGYPGDYLLTNMIYDLCDQEISNSSFANIIHKYVYHLPIIQSNLERKQYLKEKIKSMALKKKGTLKVASFVCGPANEITELVKEGLKISCQFYLIDFENKALDYIKKEIAKIENSKKKNIKVTLLNYDLKHIILNKIDPELRDFDLIYSFGFFDYLKDNFSKNMIKNFIQLLNKRGSVILINANDNENVFHKTYYEMLGEWVFYHRSREEMLSWIPDNIKNDFIIKFDNIKHDGYHIMVLSKK
ncbi:MAG: class I SAM-dependent methyltransferase [Candidatus Margulisbacteria bacterium]|nr:class I SAM-dependent methyltransferase [Candidatus Margulisiibacteriota bacterium]